MSNRCVSRRKILLAIVGAALLTKETGFGALGHAMAARRSAKHGSKRVQRQSGRNAGPLPLGGQKYRGRIKTASAFFRHLFENPQFATRVAVEM
jgi:hypothetical protein